MKAASQSAKAGIRRRATRPNGHHLIVERDTQVALERTPPAGLVKYPVGPINNVHWGNNVDWGHMSGGNKDYLIRALRHIAEHTHAKI